MSLPSDAPSLPGIVSSGLDPALLAHPHLPDILAYLREKERTRQTEIRFRQAEIALERVKAKQHNNGAFHCGDFSPGWLHVYTMTVHPFEGAAVDRLLPFPTRPLLQILKQLIWSDFWQLLSYARRRQRANRRRSRAGAPKSCTTSARKRSLWNVAFWGRASRLRT